MKTKKITLCLLVILCSFSVHAKMIKCTDNKGKVSYGTSPCQENQNEDQTITAKRLQNELDFNSRPETKEMFAREAARVNAGKKSSANQQGSSDNQLSTANLYSKLQDAKANNDMVGFGMYRDLLLRQMGNANSGSTNQMDTQKREMEGQIQAQKSQLEMKMRSQQMGMEAQMRHEANQIQLNMQNNMRMQELMR